MRRYLDRARSVIARFVGLPIHRVLMVFTIQKGARAVADPNDIQRNYKEFLDLLPLTLALAGLPRSDSGKYYTEEQIESRVFTLRHAYKAARSVARECIQK